MEQITIQVKDKQKARALKVFLKSLDYVEKVSISSTKMPVKSSSKKADFFSYSGIWSDYDLSVAVLRQSAWQRRA